MINENPLTKHYDGKFEKQEQAAPGLQQKMTPVPDCGETSYKGTDKLTGKKALVTGGDSGIGRAAAIAYAKEGADVAINYLPAEEADAQEVKKVIEEAGQKAVLIPGDLRDETFNKELVEQAVKELGGIDILCSVAGEQTAVEKIEDLSTEQLRSTFETNVYSLVWTIQAALPHLNPGASIITTSSVQSYNPSKNLVDYAATKSAIVSITKSLATQLADKGIRVNSVAPGPIWTALQITGGQPQEKIPEFGQKVDLQRAGQPVELSDVYVFLASDNASYVTGQVYGVTGGVQIN
ncbi:SDR family oxidoreductase [Macrococcus hajekii]|uniref:SDR family oxidoreductase n=1 Tax=Macrococcus hajekii TaxID=198482 RepID=A0A4R6BJY0_9STAP|nr:SDR family oxidoreductase [Macrococcus hajekii]TDM01916.1 SDR family oxidoreductase [Macrococcus hajekii]GGB08528.1 putative oxidoreductase YhxD [Macrococcus hajekii]